MKLQPGVQCRDRRRQRAPGGCLDELVEGQVLAAVVQQQHGPASGRLDADAGRGGPEPLVRSLEPRAMPLDRPILVIAVGRFPEDAAMPSPGPEKQQTGVVWAGLEPAANGLGRAGVELVSLVAQIRLLGLRGRQRFLMGSLGGRAEGIGFQHQQVGLQPLRAPCRPLLCQFESIGWAPGGQGLGNPAHETQFGVGRGRQLRQVSANACRRCGSERGFGQRAQVKVLPLKPGQRTLQNHFRIVQDRRLVQVRHRREILACSPQQLAAHQPKFGIVRVLFDCRVEIFKQIGQSVMVSSSIGG